MSHNRSYKGSRHDCADRVTYHRGEYFVRVKLRLECVDGAKTGDERAADTGHSDLA